MGEAAETLNYYGYTLELRCSATTGRWHGVVHYPEGKPRWDSVKQNRVGTKPQRYSDATRERLMQKLVACASSNMRHRSANATQASRPALDPTRLAKLLAMLSAPNDNEVLVAARKLASELKRSEVPLSELTARMAKG